MSQKSSRLERKARHVEETQAERRWKKDLAELNRRREDALRAVATTHHSDIKRLAEVAAERRADIWAIWDDARDRLVVYHAKLEMGDPAAEFWFPSFAPELEPTPPDLIGDEWAEPPSTWERIKTWFRGPS